MTLYRQLLIFTLALFVLLLAGTWFVTLHSTRTFLQEQLGSHAQDTATSLGLSISPHLRQGDMSAVETMFNAVFDRGYYHTVRLLDIEGRVLIDRQLDVEIEGVPGWFVSLVPLEAPRATSIVPSGWNQAGIVLVKCHPGYVYKTLWQNVARTAFWFVGMILVVFVGGGLGLRLLLKPLKKVEEQAETLCRKQYRIQAELPGTTELRQVVEAMNRMTCKVKDMFEEQARVAEKLRRNAYHDPLTGLGNRRYLEGQVATRLDRGHSSVKAAFLLVELHDLQALNKKKGFQVGDELVKRLGLTLRSSVEHVPHYALARLTGGSFGLFLPDVSMEEGSLIAESIVKGFAKLSFKGLTLAENVGHVGGVVCDRIMDLSQLLSGADTALRRAQLQGENKWVIDEVPEESGEAVRGQRRWADTLNSALAENNILLYVQPVVQCDDRSRIVHLEIFSRIRDDAGRLLSAGSFIPLAERLEMVSSLDRVVLEKVMGSVHGFLETDRISVNVSPSSLQDTEFRKWLLTALKQLPAKGPKLSFEFAEYGAIQCLDLVREFGKEVQGLGHGYGLDHFGQGFSSFGYLKSLQPDFIKIDRAYTDELRSRGSDSHFFIASLTGVVHSLDIMVIAEGVETQEQLGLLRDLNLDAVQGYVTGRPEPVASRITKV